MGGGGWRVKIWGEGGVRSHKKSWRGGQWKIMSSLGGGGQILNGIAQCK